MDLNLRHVRYFIAVAEELHFRGAAQKLNVAQPAVSRAVAQLERDMGLTLLQRTNRQVALTDAGRIFLSGCQTGLGRLARAVEDARRAESGEIGELRIAYTDFAISGALPTLVEGFRSRTPEVQLELTHRFTYQQIEDLDQDRLDFGFLTGPLERAGLKTLTVQEERFVVVLSPEHPLASEREIALSALADQPFVLGTPSSWKHYHDHLYRLCRSYGFEPRMAQTAFNTEGIFGLVASNMGIAVLTEAAQNYHRKGLVIRPLKDCDETVPTLAVWRGESEAPGKRRFVSFLRDALK